MSSEISVKFDQFKWSHAQVCSITLVAEQLWQLQSIFSLSCTLSGRASPSVLWEKNQEHSSVIWSGIWSCLHNNPNFYHPQGEMSEPTRDLTNKPFAAQLSHVYLSILALFCFKLFVKISLNLLAYFYIVRGNRKEAARISAEFYDYGQHSKYHHEFTQ